MAENTGPVRREYDRIALDYDRRWRPYIDATMQAIVDALELDGNEKLLDVPCGTGELEQRLPFRRQFWLGERFHLASQSRLFSGRLLRPDFNLA